MTRYAITEDRTPNRCTIVRVVEYTPSHWDHETGSTPSWWRDAMKIADGVQVEPGDRAWHNGSEITAAR